MSATSLPAAAPSRFRLPALTADTLLVALATLCGAGLLAALAAHGLKAPANVNSYGALAQAFLDGHLDVPRCPETDCALFQGRTYVIFPPFPALVALPFVAVFGPAFKGFVALGAALWAVTLVLWDRLLRATPLAPRDRIWLLAALAFGSPLFGVTFRAEAVWFFAQSVGVLMMTLALWAALCRRAIVLAAAFLGCAFLCRQMAVFWMPALIALAASPEERWLRPSRALLARIAAAGAVFGFFVAAYCIYNALRFGAPFETGYRFIANATDTFMDRRIAEIGLFSTRYFVQNLFYLFVQGFHIEFGGRHLLQAEGMDPLGTSLLAASPWLVLALYMRVDRVAAVALVSAGTILGITLFYHSNGFYQLNMQRYALDWLPLVVLLMARAAPRPAPFAALPLLATWSLALNLVTLAVVSLYGLKAPV
jgi:hypothetical protein